MLAVFVLVIVFYLAYFTAEMGYINGVWLDYSRLMAALHAYQALLPSTLSLRMHF